ncbi:MAG: response regulator [Fusobacteriota bacterium]
MRGLIVEDDKTTRSIVKLIAGKYGDVEVVENGVKGVMKFKEAVENGNHFDFICLDLAMPGKNGYEVLDEVRQIEKENNLVGIKESTIIIMSAFNQPEDIKKGYEKFCDHYLVKPFKKADLTDILDDLKEKNNE